MKGISKWFLMRGAGWLQTYLAKRGLHATVTTLGLADADGYCGPDAQAYVGSLPNAMALAIRGILPEAMHDDESVCSIGFCEREQKWYGWSHRAMYGFGIGDVVDEGHCAATSGWIDEHLEEHPEDDLSLPVGFTARTLDDAKRIAVAFAESVG